MRSALTSLSVLATGLMILAVTGCSSGGSSEEMPPEIPPPPGMVDDTPRIAEPAVKYLYFVADLYDKQDLTQAPAIRPYQYEVTKSGNLAAEITQKNPLTLFRPPVALEAGRLSHAFAVMQENNRFWYLAPDEKIQRPLTSFNQTTCDLPTGLTPATEAWFRARRVFLTGIGYEHAGIYVRTPGSNGVCDLADDQFWAISLAAKDTESAQPVSKEVAFGLPLLDRHFRLQGYIYAAPGEAVTTLNADRYVVQGQVAQTGGGLADGYVLLYQPYGEEDDAVLVIGSRLYLVHTSEVARPEFVLPQPLLTLSRSDEVTIRFDEDHFYLIDGTSLMAVDYASQNVSELFDGASLRLTSLSFGNPDQRHSAVFTADHVWVLGESAAGRQLLAIQKTQGQVAFSIDRVTEEYLIAGDWVYVSRTEQGEAGETAWALVYRDVDGQVQPPEYSHENGRWHFFRDKNEYRAFLIIGSHYEEDFFSKPEFFVYDPSRPAVPEYSLGSFNENIRIAEMGNVTSGYQLLTIDIRDGAKRSRNLYYLDPKHLLKPLSPQINYDWQNTIVCPRIDFDRPSSYCGGN